MTETAHDFDYEIKDEDIERSRALIGLDQAYGIREFYSMATADALRNFARGYGDDNPLFVDPSYGPGTRWGSQIAPPMIGTAMSVPLLGDPLPDDVRKATKGLFPGVHLFVSGRSVIRVSRQVRMNQRAEIVSVTRIILIAAERKKARERRKYMDLESGSYTDEQIAEIDAIYAAEKPQGAEPRYYEDVQAGDALPPMAKGPLTLTEIICFHAGGYGLAPYDISAFRIGYKNRQKLGKFYVKNAAGIPDVAQRVHWETEWSQAIGNPMPYDYAVMRECRLTHYLTDWIGDDGWLLRQHDEMRKFNYIGDAHIITGEVTGKRVENGRCEVDIDFRATNQRDQVSAPARATVLLPSREHGPVLPPEPPAELNRPAVQMMERHRELSRAKERR